MIYKSLKTFYPFYLTEHANPICRTLHYLGTILTLTVLVWMIIAPVWWKIALMPVAGYGFSWIGHFFFEKNKPAAFKQPFYSLISDFIMCWHFMSGQLDIKLAESKEIMNIR